MQSKDDDQLCQEIQDALGQQRSITLAQKLVHQVQDHSSGSAEGVAQAQRNAEAPLVHASQKHDTEQMSVALEHLLGNKNISWIINKLAYEYDVSDSDSDNNDNNNRRDNPDTPVDDHLRRYGLSLATGTSYKSEEAAVKALQDHISADSSSTFHIKHNCISACLFFTNKPDLEELNDKPMDLYVS